MDTTPGLDTLTQYSVGLYSQHSVAVASTTIIGTEVLCVSKWKCCSYLGTAADTEICWDRMSCVMIRKVGVGTILYSLMSKIFLYLIELGLISMVLDTVIITSTSSGVWVLSYHLINYLLGFLGLCLTISSFLTRQQKTTSLVCHHKSELVL